jgi:hypothetical protein
MNKTVIFYSIAFFTFGAIFILFCGSAFDCGHVGLSKAFGGIGGLLLLISIAVGMAGYLDDAI